MLLCMRTTIDVADPLVRQARQLAEKRGTTLRALVEEGLRLVLERSRAARPYRLPDHCFGGRGARAGLADGLGETDWERIRDLSYEGRGS